ncbi:MAG TPA: RDD family protein [Candidatus Limnocylindrales bacterium]|nr:RDD family protein [Candidatus Limnocylindrales bacterium]
MSVQPPPPQGVYTPPPVNDTPPVYQPGPAPGIRYSSRLGRLLAYFIDGFVIGIVAGIPYFIGIMLVTLGVGGQGDGSAMVLIGSLFLLLGFILAVVYKPWMWSRGGQTVGYKVMRLRVVRGSDGGPVSGGQAIGRILGYIVSGFLFSLGFIWIAFDEKRQGWHDKLAGTVVIEV